ncbi:putative spermidine/putrescine transport system permease protein [Stella humosa]|uniref:Putative spermidine/putrescine transport system permease protein n=1 Tax=Stella humosa TaxID=94 RepID=A0A3N1MBZ9_9PROT|nr:ABC transporter permease subunit [Stella humosa]ROQ00280.1 putative spermidine/putrescine transport system permease protein [Stella humosa]BBK30482.1 ABC transporter permease [Stella humosa]
MTPHVPRPLLLAFLLPGVVLFTVFFLLPLSLILAEAGSDGGVAFMALLSDPVFWNGLGGSLLLGTVAPAFSLVVGFVLAAALARMSPARRTAALFAISLPLTFSGLIVAYGFILLLGRAGFLTQLLAMVGFDPAVVGGLIFSPAGLGLAYSYYLIPRVVLVVLPALRNFDPAQLAAARSLGAGRFRTVVEILLPQIVPSLLAAYCLTAAVAIGAYGTALALAGTQVNILPLLLYSKVSETGTDLPAAAAISIVLVALCSLVIVLGEALSGRRRPSH